MITTARLLLEPARAEHATAMFEGLSDTRAYEFIPDAPPGSVMALAARYAGLESGKSPDGTELWLNWMIKNRQLAEYVGYVQATVMPDEAAMLIAYHVFPKFWGEGFGREAVAGMLKHCHAAHGVREVLAYIDTRNFASLRLVEVLGFARAALIPGADFFRGEVSDEYFYRRTLG